MHVADQCSTFVQDRLAEVRTLFPGVVVCLMVALAAEFISVRYGAPSMLMALLFGIALNFMNDNVKAKPGIAFASRNILRFSVALLGARISVDMLIDIGAKGVGLVIFAVIATIGVGQVLARLLGRGWRLGLVTGGSVAICGASAAMAVAAVTPKNEHSERNLVFTVMSVTILSTIAMVFYPLISQLVGFDDRLAGIFLGGSIHDVAQVVGAGFSVSDEAGQVATLVKLIRVTMLAPVVLVLALIFRNSHGEVGEDGKRPPILPAFVVWFLILAALNSFHLIPAAVTQGATLASRWGLVIAIAGVGIKTALGELREIGSTAIWLVTAETIFIGLVVLAGVYVLM